MHRLPMTHFGTLACAVVPAGTTVLLAMGCGDGGEDKADATPVGPKYYPPGCDAPTELIGVVQSGPCAWTEQYCCDHADDCLPCEQLNEAECRADTSGRCWLDAGVTMTDAGPACRFTQCHTNSACAPSSEYFSDFYFTFDPKHPDVCYYTGALAPVGWVVSISRPAHCNAPEDYSPCIGF